MKKHLLTNSYNRRGITNLKRNAFTLIELLAIIVVLAIIAVITVPIILNIIESARKGAAAESAYGYIRAIQLKQVSSSNNNLSGDYTIDELESNGISVNGKKPTDGYVTIVNKNISGCIIFGEYRVLIEDDEVKDTEKGKCGYTVTFNSNGGSSVAPIQIIRGTITKPANPTKAEVKFLGWFTDSNLTNKFDFSTEITSDITLYAKWGIPSIADYSWTDIIANLKEDSHFYDSDIVAGTTKDIDMGTLGTHKLRIANTSDSVDNGCREEVDGVERHTTGFSETACGVVFEFADIITTHIMNPYTNGSTNGDGSKGGWEYSDMRTYINSDIYNAIPEPLKSAIINTIVVSGHGAGDTNNFTTTDKLYLLSNREVWNYTGSNDTAQANTRQLDYYEKKGVTTSSYGAAIKKNGNNNAYWWLRSANSSYFLNFYSVYTNGNNSTYYSNRSYGVSPAFRINID